jgi:hypothetical protein
VPVVLVGVVLVAQVDLEQAQQEQQIPEAVAAVLLLKPLLVLVEAAA